MMQGSRKPVNILYIAAEAEPFARVGGLGDVAGALPLALRAIPSESSAKLDVRLAIPYYQSVKEANFATREVTEFEIPTRAGSVLARIYETMKEDLPVYMIDGTPIAAVDTVYSSNFKMDAEKFIFFSLACLFFPKAIGWELDILHANDWHTAAAVYQLKRFRNRDPFFKNVRGLISIHNLPFMGTGAADALKLYGIHPARNPLMPSWSHNLPLPMGIDAADWILTVSPHYAEEILTPGFGCDLQDYLKSKVDHLSGILNGVDTELWNPSNDRHIKQTFDVNNLSFRWANKSSLQRELGLPQNSDIPLLAYVGRMENQKGVDLILDSLSRIKTAQWQCVILGAGNKSIEAEAHHLQDVHPENVRVVTKFDIPLSHRIYAGADMLLMPSRYEPCGLAQMIAMRYGCIPIASATGGLVNTITTHTSQTVGTGFLFDMQSKDGLKKTIEKSLKIFKKTAEWQGIQRNAMTQDHSWKNSAYGYARLYEKVLKN